jgi:hypothetical protein
MRKGTNRQDSMAREYETGNMCQNKSKERRPMHAVGPHI